MCYVPFRIESKKGGGSGTCPTPADAELAIQLPLLINMQGMLTQGAVDAYTDNPDALLSQGKNFQFVDFIDPNNTGKDTRRLYFPWDLDAVFRSTTGNIYASGNGRRVSLSPYQEVILRHPTFRVQYNQIMLDLLNGPLAVANVQSFLTQAEAVIASALANDPFPTTDGSPANEFNRLRAWVAARCECASSTGGEWTTRPAPLGDPELIVTPNTAGWHFPAARSLFLLRCAVSVAFSSQTASPQKSFYSHRASARWKNTPRW